MKQPGAIFHSDAGHIAISFLRQGLSSARA